MLTHTDSFDGLSCSAYKNIRITYHHYQLSHILMSLVSVENAIKPQSTMANFQLNLGLSISTICLTRDFGEKFYMPNPDSQQKSFLHPS